MPPTNHAVMQNLKWIQIASVGYTHLFGLDLPARDVRATNARGCFDVPIAEWNIAMMVNLVCDLRQVIRNQDAALWDRSATFQRELRGATVGIWAIAASDVNRTTRAPNGSARACSLTRNGVEPTQNTYIVPGTGDPEGGIP